MDEEKEEKIVDEMHLSKDLQPSFGDMMDELIKTIPQDKLYTKFTCYTIKHMMIDDIVFGKSVVNSHVWYDKERNKLQVLLEHYSPIISDFYSQHGMGFILTIENGEWRVHLCTMQKIPGKEFLDYCYMKNMGQPRELNAVFQDWLRYFEGERKKEREEAKRKWEAEHPKVEESEKVEEPVKEGFFKGIFNKIF